MVVLHVGLEVVRKAVDSLGEQCNLNFGGTRVTRVRFILADYLALGFLS